MEEEGCPAPFKRLPLAARNPRTGPSSLTIADASSTYHLSGTSEESCFRRTAKVVKAARSCVLQIFRVALLEHTANHVDGTGARRMAELSLSERLRIVSDPRPAEFNPDEEDWELLSGTRLSQSRTYDDQGTAFSSRKGGVSSAGSKRRRVVVAADETDSDPRYAGRPVSRRELFGATEDGEPLFQPVYYVCTVCVCVCEIRVCWTIILSWVHEQKTYSVIIFFMSTHLAFLAVEVKLANVCCCLAYS